MLVGYLGAAFGSFAVAMTRRHGLRADRGAISFRSRSPMSSIAFSPGAQDTMMVLALALHLDPVYVGAHHLARFLVVDDFGGDRARGDLAKHKPSA